MGERVVVVGNGGREHAMGIPLDASDDVEKLYFLPGNAGTGDLDKGENVGINPIDVDRIVQFAREQESGLVVVGPEAPLVAGLADRLQAEGIPVFGPSAEAAKLEGSKAYATEFMVEHGIPHPPTVVAHDFFEAMPDIMERPEGSYVIKADGLAGGKGVLLPDTHVEAKRVLAEMFEGKYDGAGKETVLIQNRYHGPEVSVFVVCDGEKWRMLPLAQDHKRLFDNDEGPNTGGMGAYATVPRTIVSFKQEDQLMDIVDRTVEGMRERGVPFRGLLYVGAMLAEELGGRPAVIEYNVRFGDPEVQVLMAQLQEADADVFGTLKSAAEGRLNPTLIPSQIGTAALTVCMAANGYPSNPDKGQIITGLNRNHDGAIIHHGGTKYRDGKVVANGGRVLYVTGTGETVDDAAEKAYAAIENIHFGGAQYRTDIGHQARSL